MRQNQPLNLNLRLGTWLLQFRKMEAAIFFPLDVLKLSLQLSFIKHFSIFNARKIRSNFLFH